MPQTPTLRQLRYFLALCDAGHYGRAAEGLGISQPSLSLQITAIEQRLGLRLFERGRRGAVLTPEGRALRSEVRRVSDALESLVDTATRLQGGFGARLRLGSTPTIGPYLLPSLVRRLTATHADAQLVLTDAAPSALALALQEGRQDVILTQLPADIPRAEVVRLFREPLLLAMPHGHPLAEKEDIQDADLVGQDLLTLSEAYPLHTQVAALARDLGAVVRRDYAGTSLDALRQMVAMRMGLAFFPALYVRSEITARGGDVVVRPFRRGRFSRAVGLVWRSSAGHSDALQRLADVARETIREDMAGTVILEG